MFVIASGVFPAFFYHHLHYNPFLCGFQLFGKDFFNLNVPFSLSAKIYRKTSPINFQLRLENECGNPTAVRLRIF